MPTNLNSLAPAKPSSSAGLVDITALRADIIREVQSSLLEAVTKALSKVSINVPAPSVSVAAPHIHVDAPTIPPINIPEHGPIVLEVPGVAQLAELIRANTAQLVKVEQALLAREEMKVDRDANGLIKSTTTTRTA
jgi:hypothetical protein